MPAARRFPISDHCDGTRFFNPRYHVNRTLRDIWRWKRTSRPAAWPRRVAVGRPLASPPPPPGSGAVATWLTHASVLLQFPGATVLTDPHFSPCAGPFGLLGPRRVHAPALALAVLPPLDAVLLSHDHYDHCDLPTLRCLRRRQPDLQVVTPLGNAALVQRAGFAPRQIHELDWWQEQRVGMALRVVATPARHWSNRLSGRRNRRLWSGFLLEGGGTTVYFCGDTGYDDQLFQQLGARTGPLDLAILPIGAYEPRWFMAAQHCNPAEAVQIHLEVRARRSFGVHWGTFQLTDEAREAPAEALVQARAAAGVAADDFPLLLPGESLTVLPV